MWDHFGDQNVYGQTPVSDEEFDKADKYVKENFVWTDNMELIAKKLQKVNKALNGKLETKLADKLAKIRD